MTESHNYTFVPARKDHLQALAGLERDMFGVHGYPLFVIRQMFDVLDDCMVVAEDGDGVVAGYAVGVLQSGRTTAWLLSLAVNPAHRRRGLGKKLIERIADIIRKRNGKELLLTVDPSNDGAISLYRRCGFEDAGFEPDCFGPGEDRNLMRLLLQ